MTLTWWVGAWTWARVSAVTTVVIPVTIVTVPVRVSIGGVFVRASPIVIIAASSVTVSSENRDNALGKDIKDSYYLKLDIKSWTAKSVNMKN